MPKKRKKSKPPKMTSGERRVIEERVSLISRSIATYLSIANSESAIGRVFGLARLDFYNAAFEPANHDIDRIKEKIRSYFPIWTLGFSGGSKADYVDHYIRSICLYAFFPHGPARTRWSSQDKLITLAHFPSDKQIDALLKKTGLVPSTDRTSLKEDILICVACFRIESLLGSQKRLGQRSDHLAAVKINAMKLRDLLRMEAASLDEMGIDWAAADPIKFMPLNNFEPIRPLFNLREEPDDLDYLRGPLIPILDSLVTEAQQLLAETLEGPLARDKRISPLVRFLGKNLPAVFETHFGKKAGSGTTGPFSSFAQGALSLMNQPHPPSTVARAMGDVRSERVRRKNHPQ